jgi:alpha-1,2-mannosyltransferase
MTMFGLAGAALAASRDRWWLAGISIGIGMWARPHIGLVAAVIGLGMAWSRRAPIIAVALAVPTTLSLALLGAWNNYVFGSWNPLGAYSDHKVSAVVPDLDEHINQFENVAGFLISPDRGFLVWTPIVIVLLPAVRRSWGFVPAWPRWLALGGVAYTALQLTLNYFGGAEGFYGYRHGLELLVCITPVYVLALGEGGRQVLNLAAVVAGLQFAMIAPGAVFEAFYVRASDVWVDNSFVFAMRHHPLVFAPFTALCLLIGWRMGRRVTWCSDNRTPEESAQSVRTAVDRARR